MALEQRHLDFLTDVLGTHGVRHSGRNLLAHLMGTYDLLETWHASQDVCLAGLFHSIYGTNAFKHRCLDIEALGDRQLVQVLIGEHAEFLVYVFCACDRPRALLQVVGHKFPQVLDRITGNAIGLSQGSLSELLEIEAANLLEQGAREQVLWRMAGCPSISEMARRALRRKLGQAA